MIGDQRHQLAARGKAHHADPVRVDAIVARVGTHPADRPPRIGSRITFDRVGRAGFAGEPVFEHEGGDAIAVERARRNEPFILEHQHAVPATGQDDDADAIRARRIGPQHGQRRAMDVVDVDAGLQPLRLVRMPSRPRRPGRPDRDRGVSRGRPSRRGGGEGKQRGDNREQKSHGHSSSSAARGGGAPTMGRRRDMAIPTLVECGIDMPATPLARRIGNRGGSLALTRSGATDRRR